MIVHCPACGQAFEAKPKMNQMTASHLSLLISWDVTRIPHECGEL